MPEFRSLNVRVTDSDGNDLEEWGVQHLRSQDKVSTYIKSCTNMSFMISVEPKLPFLDPSLPKFGHDDSDAEEGKGKHMDHQSQEHSKKAPVMNGHSKISSTHRRTGSGYEYPGNAEQTGPSNADNSLSSLAGPHANESALPFHLMASLFLDGRKIPERRVIVYLDPAHRDFRGPNGKVRFRNRLVKGRDGRLSEHCWIFKEVGIEALFDKMLVRDGQNSTEDEEEHLDDDLIDALNAAKLGAEGNLHQDEQSSVGQISVVFQRVTLGDNWLEPRFHTKHREGDADDVEMDGANKEITHTAGLRHAAVLPSKALRVVHFTPFKAGEKPYATFRFFYRSQQTLEKFGFPGFPCLSNRSAMTRRQLQDKMANITPLSVTYRLPKPKRKGGSFLESNKKDTLAETEPMYQCNGNYREPTAAVKKTSEGRSRHKKSLSNAATVRSIGSSAASPRKRQIEVLRSSKRSEKQAIWTDDASTLSKSFIAEKRPDLAFSVPSLPKSTTLNANTLKNGALAFMEPYLSSSTLFISKGLEASSEPGLFGSPSTKSNTISTQALSELKEILDRAYRKPGQGNDADDVEDKSETETVLGAMDEPSNDDLLNDEVDPSLEQDDCGLQTELQALSIIGKKRRTSDRFDNFTTNEQSGKISGATLLKNGGIKLEPSAFSTLQASSGNMADSDEDGDFFDANKPCPKRTKMSAFGPNKTNE